MKKISRRSFLAAAAVSAAALAMTACGGSASSAASSVASSAASSTAASSGAAALSTVVAGKLTMATNATFPPYEMTTDSGEIEGIDVDKPHPGAGVVEHHQHQFLMVKVHVQPSLSGIPWGCTPGHRTFPLDSSAPKGVPAACPETPVNL